MSLDTEISTVGLVPYFFQACYHVVVVALAAVLVATIRNLFCDFIPIDRTTFAARGCLCS